VVDGKKKRRGEEKREQRVGGGVRAGKGRQAEVKPLAV